MSPTRRRTCALALLVAGLLATCGRVPRAVADADPPSDLLLGTPIYYPYEPNVPASLQRTLNRAVAELQRSGLHLKVAIIATKIDLGAIPQLFGRPQTYANFLDQELAFRGPQPLLVVMPDGFGISHAGAPGALAGLSVDSRHSAGGLARSAILAVQRIAGARGVKLPIGPVPSASGALPAGSGGLSPVLIVGIAALVGVAASRLLAAATRRARAAERGGSRPAG